MQPVNLKLAKLNDLNPKLLFDLLSNSLLPNLHATLCPEDIRVFQYELY
jgi:hypothetical protein